MDIKKTNFPFDQYSRLFQVSQVINCLRKGNQEYKILDVGGYGGKSAEFFPSDKITIIDVFNVNEPGYVKGDGAKMPFSDKEFDFVLSFDVFEHIEKNKRRKFIEECTRVARIGVACAAPFESEFNTNAEVELNDIHKQIFDGEDHPWLREHIDNGLPYKDQVLELISQNMDHTLTVGSNENYYWMIMQAAFFVNNKFNYAPKELVELNSFYNNSYNISDSASNIENNYRKIVYGFNTKKEYQLVKASLEKEGISEIDKVKIIKKIINYFISLVKYYDKEGSSLNEVIIQKNKEIETLISEIDKIKSSKTYLFSQKLSRAKGVINKK